jgi:hypothetical protein
MVAYCTSDAGEIFLYIENKQALFDNYSLINIEILISLDLDIIAGT